MEDTTTKKIFNDTFHDPYVGDVSVLHDSGFEAIVEDDSGNLYRVSPDGTMIDLDD